MTSMVKGHFEGAFCCRSCGTTIRVSTDVKDSAPWVEGFDPLAITARARGWRILPTDEAGTGLCPTCAPTWELYDSCPKDDPIETQIVTGAGTVLRHFHRSGVTCLEQRHAEP